MKRLITILAVFSLACLGAGGVFAESAPPGGYDIIDWVNVGDTVSETTGYGHDHNLVEWSHEFDADAAWGFVGNSDYYREIWGPTTPWNGMPADDSAYWAEIDLDFTKPPGTGPLNIGFFHLGGKDNDNFHVFIDGVWIGEIQENVETSPDLMLRSFLPVPDEYSDGVYTVRLECDDEIASGYQPSYGRVVMDEIYTFTDPWVDPAIAPVAVDSDPINCSDTKLVNFHYTPGSAPEVKGYTVRVACDASLTFGPGDVTFAVLPFGASEWHEIREVTAGQIYDLDYVILGGSVGISAEDDLFSVNFHGAGTGTGTVSITSVDLRDLTNTSITPVVSDGTSSILVDCDAPTGTFVINIGDPTYTNSVNVDLQLSVAGATEMRFTNVLDDWSLTPENDWVSLATPHAWELLGVDGAKIVYGEFRDDAGNVLAYNDGIELDTTPPGGITGLTASRGKEKVHLEWANNGGVDQTGVEMWRAVWHKGVADFTSVYPEYNDVAGNVIPTVPADRAAAALDPAWSLVTTLGIVTSHPDLLPVRGLYYYAVYPVDGAGLYGDGDDASSFSYLLGDVASPYSGTVTLDDITDLGAAYGTAEVEPADPSYNNECDVGPTDDYSGSGLPDPDNVIDFDDLMIFALNWDVSVSKTQPTEGSLIARFSWVENDDTTWSLVLAEPCANLKGVNLQADLAQDAALKISAGSLLGQQDSSYFLQNIPRNGLDAGLALLGNGACITGRGELIRVSLTRELDLEDIEIEARDSANKDLEYSLEKATAEVDMPTRYMLSANYPNPFNPSTKIDFALPEMQHVKLAVYSIDGRRITTLKNESMPAGRYTVTWTGRDDQG